MTYDLAPAHADTDAPRPGRVGYQPTHEAHGCGGNLAVEIHPITGATCECCTGCNHRRIIGRFVTPQRRMDDPENAPTPLTPTGRLSRAKSPSDATRPCARPACDRIAARTYCSAICYRIHRRDEAEAKAAAEPATLCGCGCAAPLTRHQVVYASPACRRRAERARASLRPTHCACGCGKPLTGHQTMYASRHCQHQAAIRRGIEHRAQRAGAGQVAA